MGQGRNRLESPDADNGADVLSVVRLAGGLWEGDTAPRHWPLATEGGKGGPCGNGGGFGKEGGVSH